MRISERRLREIIYNVINEDSDLKKAYDARLEFDPSEVERVKNEVHSLALIVAKDYVQNAYDYFDNHVEVEYSSLTDNQIEDARSEFMELIGKSE